MKKNTTQLKNHQHRHQHQHQHQHQYHHKHRNSPGFCKTIEGKSPKISKPNDENPNTNDTKNPANDDLIVSFGDTIDMAITHDSLRSIKNRSEIVFKNNKYNTPITFESSLRKD